MVKARSCPVIDHKVRALEGIWSAPGESAYVKVVTLEPLPQLMQYDLSAHPGSVL